MTQEQFKDIQEKLRVWREERGLSIEGQRKNFRVNYTKELVEFFEAERDGNEYEMIDALCDMLIVAINAGFSFYPSSQEDEEGYTTFFRIMYVLSGCETNNLGSLVFELSNMGYDPYKCLLETIKELNSRTGSWSEEEGKWVKDEGAYTIEEAQGKAGFNYINKLSKGVKHWYVLGGNSLADDLVQKSFVRWYKADYASCKLESVK